MIDIEREIREALLHHAPDVPAFDGSELPLVERRTRTRQVANAIGAVVVASVAAFGVTTGVSSILRADTGKPADEAPPTPTPSPNWEVFPPSGVDWENVPPMEVDWASVPGVSIDGDAFVDIGTGEVTPLPDTITSFRDAGGYAVAPGGDVLLFEASADGSRGDQIFVANVDGTGLRQLTDAPWDVTAGGWSPDGTKIVALLWGPPRPDGGDVDLVLVDTTTGETTVLASGPDHDFWEPHFSADGRWVLFSRDTTQGTDLFGVPVAGGNVELVFEERGYATFSPDGRTIFYYVSGQPPVRSGGWSGTELWLADADGTTPRPLVWEEASMHSATWSPDGTRIAYSRWHPEQDERIVVVDAASGTPTYFVLTRAGLSPAGGSGEWLDDDTLLVDVDRA